MNYRNPFIYTGFVHLYTNLSAMHVMHVINTYVRIGEKMHSRLDWSSAHMSNAKLIFTHTTFVTSSSSSIV